MLQCYKLTADYTKGEGKMQNKNIIIVLIVCIAAVLLAVIVGMFTFIMYTRSSESVAQVSETPITMTASPTEAVSTPAPPSTLYVTNVNNSIYLRQTPDDNGTILTTIPLGSAVEMINNENNGFTRIKYNNIEGYSKTEYLTADPTAANQVPANQAPSNPQYPSSSLTAIVDTMYVTNVKNSIYLREGGSDNAGIITTIPLGASVGYIADLGNGFYKVSYNGQMGYSKAQYLTTRSPYSSYYDGNTYMRVTGVKNSIYLRRTPSAQSDNICEIPVGARVVYISRYNDSFYKISYGGSVGYATAQYLTFE